ncbi:uncharacterized protein LOC123354000 [Mauremys mutica]|uniref:uncharacterized protein LOC123354000 n=1 Tax=Mauremys mutica TaxID=74926 RepID=UPI001D1648D8|nr:uncharacterized protein LOC123354000 [Mauremys mutica]
MRWQSWEAKATVRLRPGLRPAVLACPRPAEGACWGRGRGSGCGERPGGAGLGCAQDSGQTPELQAGHSTIRLRPPPQASSLFLPFVTFSYSLETLMSACQSLSPHQSPPGSPTNPAKPETQLQTPTGQRGGEALAPTCQLPPPPGQDGLNRRIPLAATYQARHKGPRWDLPAGNRQQNLPHYRTLGGIRGHKECKTGPDP